MPNSNWRDLDLPFSGAIREIRKLSGGRSNDSTLIQADGQHWVLRLGSSNDSIFGIDRHSEEINLRLAAKAGIAPQVAFCSVAHGVLVTEFIDGTHWPADTLLNPEKLEIFKTLVYNLHALQTPTRATDYYRHAESYWSQLVEARLNIPNDTRALRDQVLENKAATITKPAATRLCHRDITPSNVIEREGRLYLLDWEYATRGEPSFDFATIATEWLVSNEQLLKGTDISAAQLKSAQMLYRYTCQLWELLNATLIA